jgi:hypothetical protein
MAVKGGAFCTIWLLIPVNWVISGGMIRFGLINVENSASILDAEKRTAPISIMASLRESNTVV